MTQRGTSDSRHRRARWFARCRSCGAIVWPGTPQRFEVPYCGPCDDMWERFGVILKRMLHRWGVEGY